MENTPAVVNGSYYEWESTIVHFRNSHRNFTTRVAPSDEYGYNQNGKQSFLVALLQECHERSNVC